MPTNGLTQKLNQIKQVFDVDDLLKLKPDKNYIQKYYKANRFAYSLFHTHSGIIHMGISRDGVYKESDLLAAARIIEKYQQHLKAKNILELATGRGGTSIWLSERYPQVKFSGIELSPAQLVYAKKKTKKLTNFYPELGDYHDLNRYQNNSQDIVFVIEALCYSRDKAKVLAEVNRVLKDNGVFIILDAYSKITRKDMNTQQLLACRLTELGMAVQEFSEYPNLLAQALNNNFVVESSEDVSECIVPTLKRFESLAVRFFSLPMKAKFINRILSKEVTYNAISGLLMPSLISEGLAGYYITVLRKA